MPSEDSPPLPVSMCSQKLMDGFIADFFLYVGTYERTDGFGRQEIYLFTEKVFEEKTELDEIVVALLSLLKLDDQVDIAILTLFSACIRAEQPDSLHSMTDEKIIVLSDANHYLVTGHLLAPFWEPLLTSG